MKFYSVLILFLLIEFTINTDCDHTEPSSKNDCIGKLSEEEKGDGYSYCCYGEVNNGAKGCWRLKKADYDDIKNFIKNEEKDMDGAKIKSLKCNSLFLKLGLMNILLFLL